VTDQFVIVREPQTPDIIRIVAQGPQGPKGDPGIIVSPTPPPNPQINDLWLQIP
jgi:hypothetical protein